MTIVALIPARGGSVRIPRKNMQLVGGQTLVARAVICALAVRRIETVYVCTEDEEIQVEALRAGAWVCARPELLARDDTKMESVVRHFIMEQDIGDDDLIVLLEPTAPLRTSQDIEVVLDFMEHSTAPAVRTVHAIEQCHGWEYYDAGIASVIRVRSFAVCLFPPSTALLHGADGRGVDVDELSDLILARALA